MLMFAEEEHAEIPVASSAESVKDLRDNALTLFVWRDRRSKPTYA